MFGLGTTNALVYVQAIINVFSLLMFSIDSYFEMNFKLFNWLNPYFKQTRGCIIFLMVLATKFETKKFQESFQRNQRTVY